MLAAAGLSHPASHYGASTVVQPARQVAPSVQCRTEYVTLWDTEYQEKEERCAPRSTSRTLRPSVPPSTRRTASTSGRERAMTRCGLPLMGLARTFPTRVQGGVQDPRQAGCLPR